MYLKNCFVCLSALFLLCGCKSNASNNDQVNNNNNNGGGVDQGSMTINPETLFDSSDNVMNLLAIKSVNGLAADDLPAISFDGYAITLTKDGPRYLQEISVISEGVYINDEDLSAYYELHEDSKDLEDYLNSKYIPAYGGQVLHTHDGLVGIYSYNTKKFLQETSMKDVYNIYTENNDDHTKFNICTNFSELDALALLFKKFAAGYEYSPTLGKYVFNENRIDKDFYHRSSSTKFREFVDRSTLEVDALGRAVKMSSPSFPTMPGYVTEITFTYGEQTVDMPKAEDVIQVAAHDHETIIKTGICGNDFVHYTFCTKCGSVLDVTKCSFNDQYVCTDCGFEVHHYEYYKVIDGLMFEFELKVSDNTFVAVYCSAIGGGRKPSQEEEPEYFHETKEVIKSKISYTGMSGKSIYIITTALNDVKKYYIEYIPEGSSEYIYECFTVGQIIN